MTSWYDNFAQSAQDAQPTGGLADSWLTTTGGWIAGGIEAGLLAMLADLWNLIIGPIEVITGAGFIILAFLLVFKDDIERIAGVFR